jgi:hypothetical protein
VAQAKIMQSTSSFHHIISKMSRSASQRMHHNVAAFDATNLMLNFKALSRNLLVTLFVCFT